MTRPALSGVNRAVETDGLDQRKSGENLAQVLDDGVIREGDVVTWVDRS